MNTITDEQRQARFAASQRDTLTVLKLLKEQLPGVWDISEVVGKWVWIEFPQKPSEQVRTTLLDMGFHFNVKRMAWQHACGHFTHHSPGNPRWKYATVAASELELSAIS